MNVHNTIDVTAFYRVMSAPKPPVNEQQGQHYTPKTTDAAALRYTQSVEPARELKPVNVHPRHVTAIDTFLTIAHYSGDDTIINTYA